MTNNLFKQIKIVLCNTTHQGNVGSTARAMKTMGITNLVLVAPLHNPDDHALALSANARDIIDSAVIVPTLAEALLDCQITIAMTSRRREFSHQLSTPKEITPFVLEALNNNQKIAIVFGNEAKGLTIEQQELCNKLVTIPGNPAYFSLNLAQAVQIICYELYSSYNPNIEYLKNSVELASHEDRQKLLAHLDTLLIKTDYYKNKNPDRVQRRLQKIIHKADLEREEIDLLRGILKKIEAHITPSLI